MIIKSPLYALGLGLTYLGLGIAKLALWITPAGRTRDEAIRRQRQMRARIIMARR
jgi:hypothetical protein